MHVVRYGRWFAGVLQEDTASVFGLGYDTVLPGYIAALLGYLPTHPPPVKVLPAPAGCCVDDAKILNPSEK